MHKHHVRCPLPVGDGAACMHCEDRRYQWVCGIGIATFVLELIIGYIGNSSALRGDAWHVLADVLAAGISILAVRRAIKNPLAEPQIRKFWALMSILLLQMTALWVFWEGVEKIPNKEPVWGATVAIVTCVGMVANYLQHEVMHAGYVGKSTDDRVHLFHTRLRTFLGRLPETLWFLLSLKGNGENQTQFAQTRHILWDMFQNVVVFVVAIIIIATDWYLADAIGNFILAGLMTLSAAFTAIIIMSGEIPHSCTDHTHEH